MSELSSPPAGPLLRMFAQPRKAFSISELASVGPLSQSMLYRAIHDGSLVARKIGDRTIVLAADWDSFLQSLPKVGVEVTFQEPRALVDARRAAHTRSTTSA